jgi:hypothetical protein
MTIDQERAERELKILRVLPLAVSSPQGLTVEEIGHRAFGLNDRWAAALVTTPLLLLLLRRTLVLRYAPPDGPPLYFLTLKGKQALDGGAAPDGAQ